MKKFLIWLLTLSQLFSAGTVGHGTEEASWLVEDGVVYQLVKGGEEADHYAPIHFRKGQEVLVIPESVGGLPVYLVDDADPWEPIFSMSNLFAATDARELRIEAARVELDYLYIRDWPKLERFSLTAPGWDVGYLGIIDCPKLVDFFTDHQAEAEEEWNTFYLSGCPALESLALPAHTSDIYGTLQGCGSLRTLIVSGSNYLSDEEPISQDVPLEHVFNTGEDPAEADGVWYGEEWLALYPSRRPGTHYDVREGTTMISSDAFSSARYLKTLRLPASVEDIYGQLDVSMLEAIEVDEANETFQSIDGVVYSKDGTALVYFPGQYGTAYETPPGTGMVDRAFGDNDRLETLRLSEGLDELGFQALSGMTALREVYLPASLEVLSEWAFDGCNALEAIYVNPDNPLYKDVDGVLFTMEDELMAFPAARSGAYALPEGATFLNEFEFYGFDALESLYVPASMESLEVLRFGSRASLARIEVAADHPYYTSVDGVVFSKDGKRLVLYPPGHGDTYDVPAGTEVIGSRAFAGNDLLQGISFPRSLRAIEKEAFSACTALKSAVLPITLEALGDYAFEMCVSLEKMVIPQGVGEIGDDVLLGCWELRELQAPEAVTRTLGLSWERRNPMLPRVGFVRAGTGASLRQSGQAGAAVLEALPQGAGFTVLSIRSDYAQVAAGERQGYLALSEITILPQRARFTEDAGTGRVPADTPVYPGPSAASAAVATLAEGAVPVLALEGPWCRVQLEGGAVGYIEARMLEGFSISEDDALYSDELRMVWCADPLAPVSLRDAPGESAEIGRVYTGELVRVMAVSGGEAYVATDAGQYGFMDLQDTLMVEVIKEQEPPR